MRVNQSTVVLIFFLLVPVFGLVTTASAQTAANDGIVYASDLAGEIYDKVSVSSFKDYIIKLTENGSHYAGSDENVYAREWIVSTLESIDSDIEIEIYGTYENIIAKLPGSLGDGAPSFMVGGHYDTVPGAPGANDDGTGVATALELARVMSQYDWPLDIYFCFWNHEELGLYGSRESVPRFIGNETDILVYYNIDMLLVQDPAQPPDRRIWMNYNARSPGTIFHDSQYWAELPKAMDNNFDTNIILPNPSSSFIYWQYSDHYSFVERNYHRVVFASESGFNVDDAYHTEDDTWDNPSYNYTGAIKAVKSIGASMAFTMSRTSGQRTHEMYTLDMQSGETKDILFESTIESVVSVTANWTGEGSFRFESYNSINDQIWTDTETGTNFDGEVLSFQTSGLGQHRVRIVNEVESNNEVTVGLVYDTDIEGNGVPDHEENWYNFFNVDSDQDTINDADEMMLGTDRFDADADNDSLDDYQELYVHDTSANSNDTDRDLMPDGWEVQYNLNPKKDDGCEDPDEDGLWNRDEFSYGTNPQSPDSDSDGIFDGFEVTYGLDPLHDDSALDPDGDLLSNLGEFQAGSNPNVRDSFVFLIGLPAIILTVPVVVLLGYRRYKRRGDL